MRTDTTAFRAFLLAILTGFAAIWCSAAVADEGLSTATAAALAAFAQAAESEQVAAPCADPAVEGELRAALQAAVVQNPELRGAWVEVNVDQAAGRFVLQLVLDRPNAVAQQKEIERLVEEQIAAKCYHVANVDLRPFSAVLADLRRAVEDDVTSPGALITGGYYVQEGDELAIALLGRIAIEEQKAAITDLSNGVLQALPVSSPLKGVKVKAEDLAVVAPSAPVGAQFFARGVEDVIKGRFAAARDEFHLAIVEAPERLDYHYWRVVAEIGMTDHDRAYQHLRPLVDLRRAEGNFGAEYVQVLYSLERVQGPLRQKLLELEHRAFAEGPIAPAE